mgnify:FL=1
MPLSEAEIKYRQSKKGRATHQKANKRYYDRHRKEPQRWTPEKDDLILAQQRSDKELSELIGHGIRAIQVRRSKLKRGIIKP